MKIRISFLFAAAVLVSSVQAQEHSYAPSDIETGRGLYQANCLGCHGNNGDSVEGANLGKGKFRHASSDEDLIALIRAGIPNTLMVPRPQLGYGDLRALVAFLRNMQTSGALTEADKREVKIGNAKQGEQLFFGKGGCSKCHGVNGGGSRLSPDLAGIGSQRTPASLETSLLDPRKEVREGNRFMQVVTKKGVTITGKLMNQDTHSIQLMNEQEKLVSLMKSDLQSWAIAPTPMPSVQDVLSPAQVSDLVAYLVSLKSAEVKAP
ncbi:MAG TPA: c-type cytochrome [Candidatus Acidoferrum sp.]|nr:c-type cytochrome [Candidatus Acidoferrum sp.]